MSSCRLILAIVSIAFLTWIPAALAQKLPSNELSDDPEIARQLMQLPDGFEAQLVASEPAVVNPIQINFDAQGRFFVLCAPRYPQILPGQKPSDYVVMLADFDAKGKAGTTRVVVDGLMVPTGMMPGDGGVYVGQAESLLHFRARKEGEKFEQKRVVLSGFGTADTHHTLNTFRWGPDGSLYFNQGVYIHSSVETPFGPRSLFGGGIWRLRTDRMKLEVYDRAILPNNTWGHAFDAWGQSFTASAWPGALHVVLPDSPLETITQQELVPPLKITQIGGERHCGLEIVSGRHFPEDWQGNFLTGDFLSHRVYRYTLMDDGQRYLAKALPPLIQSKHRKFRPIDIKMGPDGAVYIADLYQQIIQHNQVDFRDPRRDHSRGRIWRVVRKDRPLLAVPKITTAAIPQVLDLLQAPEQWTRQQAKRNLAERDAQAVQQALGPWVQQLDPKDPNLQRHLLEALWTYQSIDRVEAGLLARLLRSEDERVRAAATRVVGAWQDRLPEALKWLAAQVADPQPRVRLEAVQALACIPSAEAVQIGLRVLDRPLDPLLEFALRKLVLLHKPYWQMEFQAGRLTFDGNAHRMAFALQTIRGDAVPTLVGLVEKHKVPRENLAEVLQLIASLGKAEEQALAFQQVLDAKALSATERIRVMESMTQAAQERRVVPHGNLNLIAALYAHENAPLASAALRLAGAWHLEAQRPILQQWASDPKADAGRRAAAIDALVDLGGSRSILQMEQLANSNSSYEVRQQAIAGLAQLDVQKAALLAGQFLSAAPTGAQDPSQLFSTFLQRKEGPAALAKSLHQTKPAKDTARIGLRVLVRLGTPAPELQAVLQAALGKGGVKRTLDSDAMQRWKTLVKEQGDARRGESVFRRATLGCLQCHAIGGAGGRVGPDLSGIGTSAQLDYLIESVLLPSKVVREGYTTAHITTKDGRLFSGVLHRENAQEIVLKDPIRDEIVLAVRDVDEKRVGGSLMPDGLDQSLTDAELTDLFAFLAELGKPGPFAVTHRAVARRWQVLAAPLGSLSELPKQTLGKVLQEDGALVWKTLYAKVSGELPLDEAMTANDPRALIRCQLEVLTPGKVALALNDAQNLTIWLDGVSISPREKLSLDLERGIHTILFRVERRLRKEAMLRCELVESDGSRAQAKFVDGR